MTIAAGADVSACPPSLPLLPMKVDVRKFIPPLFCSLPSSSRRSIPPHPPPLSPPPQSDDDGWRRRLDLLESERERYTHERGEESGISHTYEQGGGKGCFFPKLIRRH